MNTGLLATEPAASHGNIILNLRFSESIMLGGINLAINSAGSSLVAMMRERTATKRRRSHRSLALV